MMQAPDPETERLYWADEALRPYQLDRLRETVARAARSPFYASRLAGFAVTTLDDLSRLPLTTKEDLRSASPWGLLAVPRGELFQYHESYGTTGTPVSSWLTRRDFANYATQINHSAVTFAPGDRVLVRFPYAISVPAHIVTHAARERGACVVPVSSRSSVSPYTRVIDLLAKLEATVLCCLPTEAIWLAETARLLGRDPGRDFPHLRALCTAGELLSGARKARLEKLWGCRVFNLYGCTEAGNIAADCDRGRLHLSWDHFLLEVLDPDTLTPAPPGELGTAVLTTLTREAMPLLRFTLGDYVRLDPQPCPCGRQALVIDHYGRDLNCFMFGGRRFFLRDLEEILLASDPAALGDLWLVELSPGHVTFRAEAARPAPGLCGRLEAKVWEELRLPLRVETVSPGALLDRSRFTRREPVGKPRVIGERPAGASPLTLDDLM